MELSVLIIIGKIIKQVSDLHENVPLTTAAKRSAMRLISRETLQICLIAMQPYALTGPAAPLKLAISQNVRYETKYLAKPTVSENEGLLFTITFLILLFLGLRVVQVQRDVRRSLRARVVLLCAASSHRFLLQLFDGLVGFILVVLYM